MIFALAGLSHWNNQAVGQFSSLLGPPRGLRQSFSLGQSSAGLSKFKAKEHKDVWIFHFRNIAKALTCLVKLHLL